MYSKASIIPVVNHTVLCEEGFIFLENSGKEGIDLSVLIEALLVERDVRVVQEKDLTHKVARVRQIGPKHFISHPSRLATLGREVLFLSKKAVLNGAKAIRGGIPLVFPQVRV